MKNIGGLKTCSKKECCKQCGHVKFKGTMKQRLYTEKHTEQHKTRRRTPRCNRHSENTHTLFYVLLEIFFTLTWTLLSLSADDWLLKYMTKITVTTDPKKRHSGCSIINQNSRSRVVSHHWSADSEFDALLTELDRNTFEYSVKIIKKHNNKLTKAVAP